MTRSPALRSPYLRSPYLWLVAAPLIWSGNMVFGRILAGAVPPITLSAIRWAVASSLLGIILRVSEGAIRQPPRAAWLPVAAMGATAVATFTPLIYAALHEVTAVEASLIQSATPVFALFLARLLIAEGLTPAKWAGAGLTVVGVAVIVSDGDLGRLLSLHWGYGSWLMLLAALIWAGSTVAMRPAGQHLSAMAATFHSSWIGFLMLLPGVAWEWWRGAGIALTPLAVVGVAYVSIFPSAIAFLAWNYGVSRIGAGRAAVFNNLLPLFTAVWAVMLLGEPLVWAEATGGLLILAGVSLGGSAGLGRAKGEAARREGDPLVGQNL